MKKKSTHLWRLKSRYVSIIIMKLIFKDLWKGSVIIKNEPIIHRITRDKTKTKWNKSSRWTSLAHNQHLNSNLEDIPSYFVPNYLSITTNFHSIMQCTKVVKCFHLNLILKIEILTFALVLFRENWGIKLGKLTHSSLFDQFCS